ncbi:MAG TPA: TrkH family potassium uptake protein [Candidatus Mediterraneibacter stercoravium]|uniref:TrkH family potassium uptake protein n=1 Tax=Candidatus Mediterraneibacter stercoravium TaxID=2838685 RepID=A0A9D2K1Z0_9FIRM|nr:TrkH family potassium uptake protein [Candidatus Mediterraneibacter stercoravium]
MKKIIRRLTQTQMIVIGFCLVILSGTILLMLPISTREGVVTSPIDALFTTVSASCVTGLIIADTYQYWSIFGQIVIISLIQIGGLGFMTIGVFFAVVLRKKIGLWVRGTLQESVNIMQTGGIVRLAKKIIIGTAVFEGTGALILSIHFSRTMDWGQAVYYGIFHSVSAFCNAGFDLMGKDGEYISLTGYSGDWTVNLVIMLLIIIGGIGFFIWNDLSENKLHFRRWKLHTKITILMTLALVFGGAAVLFALEYNNTLAGRPLDEQILCSLFGSVTARTAGFNTLDTAALTDSSKLFTALLMFIGGSPGSTAGGIKTTTFVVLAASVYSGLFDKRECSMFGRRLSRDVVRKASTVLCTNLMLCVTAVLIIVTATSLDVTDVIFEVASAMGTVGMSAGITRDLDAVSKISLIFLMFCGRVGSMTFALSLKGHKVEPPVRLPEEEVMIG